MKLFKQLVDFELLHSYLQSITFTQCFGLIFAQDLPNGLIICGLDAVEESDIAGKDIAS